MKTRQPHPTPVVAALHRFTALPDFESLRDPLYHIMLAHEVRGTLLLAEEGINGTIAGSRHGIDAVMVWLRSDPKELETGESSSRCRFVKTQGKLKKRLSPWGY